MTKRRVVLLGIVVCAVIVLGAAAKSHLFEQNGATANWTTYDGLHIPIKMAIPPDARCWDNQTFGVQCLNFTGSPQPPDGFLIQISLVKSNMSFHPDNAKPFAVGRRDYPGYLWMESYPSRWTTPSVPQLISVEYLVAGQRWQIVIDVGSSLAGKSLNTDDYDYPSEHRSRLRTDSPDTQNSSENEPSSPE